MKTRYVDPHLLKSRDVLVAEADDIDLAIAGDLDHDPRSVGDMARMPKKVALGSFANVSSHTIARAA